VSMHGIKYYSFLEPSGYGLAALGYLNALLDLECPIHWLPLILGEQGYHPWYQSKSAKLSVEKILHECLSEDDQVARLIACLEPIDDYKTIVMHTVPEYWPYLKEADKHLVGYTVWETSRLPKHFPELINQLDRVLVPASFNKPIFASSGVDIPIHVVPHILNSVAAQTDDRIIAMRSLLEVPADNYLFYSINTWTNRKSLWTLVHAYLSSFTIDDDVSLVLKTSDRGPRHASDDSEHDTQILVSEIVAQYPRPAHVRVINHKISNDEIAALHQLGDCFVSASHSEGWGLGMFEAAGVGNSVVAIGWGGHLDFLPQQLAYLTNYELTPVLVTLGQASYSQDQRWATADPQELSIQLKKVFAQPDIARQKGQQLAEQLQQNYNSKKVGQQLYKAIYAN
jgi:glycosyltransferase involved in cell wall biosynthesis